VEVVGVTKKVTSFSLDEDIADLLSERDDLNKSAIVNQFLREYLAGGDGEEAALRIRLEQLDEEIAETEKELTQLKRERERIQDRLGEKKSQLNEVLDEVVQKVRNDEFPRSNIDSGNLAIQNWAAEAGVPADRFVDELEARL